MFSQVLNMLSIMPDLPVRPTITGLIYNGETARILDSMLQAHGYKNVLFFSFLFFGTPCNYVTKFVTISTATWYFSCTFVAVQIK